MPIRPTCSISAPQQPVVVPAMPIMWQTPWQLEPLTQGRAWVGYTEGKIPVAPVGATKNALSNALVSNPQTWGTFEQVRLSVCRMFRGRGHDIYDPETGEKTRTTLIAPVEGIGRVIQPWNIDQGLIVIDRDAYKDNVTAEQLAISASMINDVDCYAEFSPSGKGQHLIGYCRDRELLQQIGARKIGILGHVDILSAGSYATMTGLTLPGKEDAPLADLTTVVAHLLAMRERERIADRSRRLSGAPHPEFKRDALSDLPNAAQQQEQRAKWVFLQAGFGVGTPDPWGIKLTAEEFFVLKTLRQRSSWRSKLGDDDSTTAEQRVARDAANPTKCMPVFVSIEHALSRNGQWHKAEFSVVKTLLSATRDPDMLWRIFQLTAVCRDYDNYISSHNLAGAVYKPDGRKFSVQYTDDADYKAKIMKTRENIIARGG